LPADAQEAKNISLHSNKEGEIERNDQQAKDILNEILLS
jgi:hypothetical protein